MLTRVAIIIFVCLVSVGCSDPVKQWGQNSQTEWAGKVAIADSDNNGKREVAQIQSMTDMHASDQETLRAGIMWSALPNLLYGLGIIICSGLMMWWLGRNVNDFIRGTIAIRAALPAVKPYAYVADQPERTALPVERKVFAVPASVKEYAVSLYIFDAQYEYERNSWWVIEPDSNMAFQVPPQLQAPPPRAYLTG